MMCPDPFADAIAGLCTRHPCPIFMRVGAQDAGSADTLDGEIRRRGLSGMIVECCPDRLAAIEPSHADLPGVIRVNAALALHNGDQPMRRFRRPALAAGLLPPDCHGVVTADMPGLLADDGPIGSRYPDEAGRQMINALVEIITVRGRTFQSLIDQQDIEAIDILVIDTCGDAPDLLRGFDYTRHRPGIIHLVLTYVPPGAWGQVRTLLEEQGYTCRVRDDRLTAVADPARRLAGGLAFLHALAERCLADGWNLEASRIAAQMTALAPGDGTARLLSARANAALGRPADALRDLLALPGVSGMDGGFSHGVLTDAAVAINDHLAGGRLGPAAELAGLATRLVPGHEALLNVAMLASASLGRQEAAHRYALQLLALHPGHEAARWTLSAPVPPVAG